MDSLNDESLKSLCRRRDISNELLHAVWITEMVPKEWRGAIICILYKKGGKMTVKIMRYSFIDCEIQDNDGHYS